MTYSAHLPQWIHAVWFTHEQAPSLDPSWQKAFFEALTAQARQADIYLDLAGGTADHVHILLKLSPQQALAGVMEILMQGTADWLRQQKKVSADFAWSPGYAASSVSPDRVPMLRRHLRRQAQVHQQIPLERELWELDLHAQDVQCVVVGLVNGPRLTPQELLSGRVGA